MKPIFATTKVIRLIQFLFYFFSREQADKQNDDERKRFRMFFPRFDDSIVVCSNKIGKMGFTRTNFSLWTSNNIDMSVSHSQQCFECASTKCDGEKHWAARGSDGSGTNDNKRCAMTIYMFCNKCDTHCSCFQYCPASNTISMACECYGHCHCTVSSFFTGHNHNIHIIYSEPNALSHTHKHGWGERGWMPHI